MSAAEVAAEAATTDWTTYDGVVAPQFMFHAVFFPVAMLVFLMVPAAICYCCLARGRVTPYTPPNMAGAYGMIPIFAPLCPPWGRGPSLLSSLLLLPSLLLRTTHIPISVP